MNGLPNLRIVQTGFSLVEMAIVLAIVALLLTGLVPSISGQIEQKRVTETRAQLDEIKDALIGYAIINGRFPCPADGTIPTVPGVANNAGQENSTCVAGANGGVLPWATLGVSETDAWGRRFTYRVTPDFADAIVNPTYGGCTPSPTPTQSSFALCSSGNLEVWSEAAHSTSVVSNVPAVIISHGTNGLGAYTPAGGEPLTGASGDEDDNAADNNNNNFVSRSFIQNGFDDLIVWISPSILIGKMVAAGKLP